jgi:hypothetical protein
MNQEDYIKQEYERAKKNLYKKQRQSFGAADKLAAWFVEKLKRHGLLKN